MGSEKKTRKPVMPVFRKDGPPEGDIPGECTCQCHNMPRGGAIIEHVVACCFPCPKCGRRIIPSYYDSHVKECKGTGIFLLPGILESYESRDHHRYVPGECQCSCHKHPGTKHVIACCNRCPHCGRNIILAIYDRHVESCAQNEKNSNKLTKSFS